MNSNPSRLNTYHATVLRLCHTLAVSTFVCLLTSHICTAEQPLSAQRGSAPETQQTSGNLQRAEEFMRQGKLDQAKAEVGQEIEQNTRSVEAYNLLGIIESSQHHYTSALAAFQQALQIAPNSTKVHVNMGSVYVVQNQVDLAEKEFRTVLRLDPQNQDGNYNLGVLLIAKGKPAEAILHLERVHPANAATRIHLIHASLQTNRIAEALRMTTKLSAENKGDVHIHFSLGVMLASEKQFKAALYELQQANLLQPDTFEILFSLGQAYLLDGENAKAELTLARARQLKPDSPEALYLSAQALANQLRPLDALDLLVHAHKLAPENTDVILLMAQVSISQNYFEDAIPLLESGLAISPQRADLLAALGESYAMAGKVDKAIEQFKKLIEIEPSALSYAYMGLSYRNLGRFDEARTYLQKGLKLEPHNSFCLFNLGLIAERQGDDAGAEALFQQILHSDTHFPDAYLEMANLRVEQQKPQEAATLLRKYVQSSHNPATGYYKLAMVERSLHQTAAADRDLSVFKTLSKDASSGPYPFEHLFDYLDNRSRLAPGARSQLDLAELKDQTEKHPGQPENLYLLAEAYLKSGKIDEARDTFAQLDKLSAGDYRTLTGVGVLLARYRLYEEAIQHFKDALQAEPGSDDIEFDLANAYFRKGRYSDALDIAERISDVGRKDDACLSLLADIYAHLGETAKAESIFREVIARNPDNDQNYLALALLQFRKNDVESAKQILLKGQTRDPGSGKLLWGLGLAAMLEGNTSEAADRFERAVSLLPEWPGSYSTLGVFYFETGQIDKAKEVLDRFKNSNISGGLDVNRIQQVLAQAPDTPSAANQPMTMANRSQLLQLALSLADRTL